MSLEKGLAKLGESLCLSDDLIVATQYSEVSVLGNTVWVLLQQDRELSCGISLSRFFKIALELISIN